MNFDLSIAGWHCDRPRLGGIWRSVVALVCWVADPAAANRQQVDDKLSARIWWHRWPHYLALHTLCETLAHFYGDGYPGKLVDALTHPEDFV